MATLRLDTLAVGRYDELSDNRVLLCVYQQRLAGKTAAFQRDTLEKLVANDNFVKNINFMITDDETKMVIFYSRDQNMLYFAITDEQFPSHMAAPLLQDIKQTFNSRFNPIAIRNLAVNGLQSEGSPHLQRIAREFASGERDKLGKVQRDVDDVKHQMDSNINKMLEHQERLDNVEEGAEQLVDGAKKFERQSDNLAHQFCCRQYILLDMWLFLSFESVSLELF
ncbi:MAG: hypothetical protein EZS28_017936 [Streblomastix strix]|uniref:Uncharacterized protein n=1 Tax=Streblomastix strix TaxID=222440 RepID=A0A5J4VV76_9EUKA|nr:MAG: hypothetical protein EZS28_017936 [Streblomastix strix]